MIPTVFLILLCLAIIGFFSHFRMVSYLKKNHYKTWESLGKPSFLNNSIQSSIKTKAFLFKRKYLELNDATLSKKASLLVLVSYFYIGIFVLGVALVMIQIIKG